MSKIISLANKLERKYKIAEDQEQPTSNEEMTRIILNGADLFKTTDGVKLLTALQQDDITIRAHITYKNSWFAGKKLEVDNPLTFNPSVPEDKRKRYSTIPKQIKLYLQNQMRSIKYVGEEWFVDL